MKINPVYNRTATPTLDFSRVRAQTKGSPENYLSFGTVGHYDDTPAFVRVEDGDVLVEVTLAPSGDEIVARLDLDTMDGGCVFYPLSYGQRVVVGFPNAKQGDPVILSRLSDASWPFPDEVAGISTDPDPSPTRSAPAFAFIKTSDGQLLAIETGDGGDIVIHSGASTQVRVEPASQILLTGRTHMGSEAEFSEPPVGPQITNNGFTEDGTQAQPYTPSDNTNAVVPPATYVNPAAPGGVSLLPADGLMRLKDTVQSNASVDFEYWNNVRYTFVYLEALTAFLDLIPPLGAWSAALNAALLSAGITPPLTPPTTVDSIGRTSSQNTASDD